MNKKAQAELNKSQRKCLRKHLNWPHPVGGILVEASKALRVWELITFRHVRFLFTYFRAHKKRTEICANNLLVKNPFRLLRRFTSYWHSRLFCEQSRIFHHDLIVNYTMKFNEKSSKSNLQRNCVWHQNIFASSKKSSLNARKERQKSDNKRMK